MNTLPRFGLPKSEVTHKPKPSRLPLKRLAEAKVLNSQMGLEMRDVLFPARERTSPPQDTPLRRGAPPIEKPAPHCHLCGLPPVEQKFCRKCRAIYRRAA